MIKRDVVFIFWIYAALLLGVACSYVRKAWRTEDVLLDHSWVLCNLKGSKIEIEHFKGGVPFIKFDTMGNVLIFTGCDYIFGEYTFIDDDESISFRFLQDGFCLGPVGNDFITGLKGANRLEISKEKLLLMNDSSVVMTFFSK